MATFMVDYKPPIMHVAVQGTTFVAAIIAAIAGIASYNRVVAQIEFNTKGIVLVGSKVEKVADNTAALALALERFASTLSTDQANVKASLEELKARVRDLEAARRLP